MAIWPLTMVMHNLVPSSVGTQIRGFGLRITNKIIKLKSCLILVSSIVKFVTQRSKMSFFQH